MRMGDTHEGYGLVSRALHWSMAIAIFAVFALGVWMVELTYYSPYYNSAPFLHKSVGVLLFATLIVRFVWRVANPKPDASELSEAERMAAHLVHWGFYPLLAFVMISGYLISSTDGRPIDVFGLFSLPSVIEDKAIGDAAGVVHWVSAYAAIAIAVVHTAGALKHHFIDGNRVLRRMWSGH